MATGPHTRYRGEFDTTTAHHAQPQAGAIDFNSVEQGTQVYDFDQPNMWDNIGAQVTQRDYQAGKLLSSWHGGLHDRAS